MSLERPNYDGRVFGENGEPDVYIPGMFWPKLGFLLFSIALALFGVWTIWDPAARVISGEISEARVSRLERSQPGVPKQIFRYPITIEEEAYTVTYRHFVQVEGDDGQTQSFIIGVDSRKKPYANVNDTITVAYFPDSDVAFAVYHHRTWAFGLGFLSVGGILVMLAWSTVRAVGKPIIIDPESPQEEQSSPSEVEDKSTAAEPSQVTGTATSSSTARPTRTPDR